MRRKKILILAASGLIMSAMLVFPVMAADQLADSAPTDTAERNQKNSSSTVSQHPSGSDNQLPGETVPYPMDIQLLEQGARNYLYKTYTVAADYNPDMLVEADYSQGGYRYRFSEIIQRDSTPSITTKTVTESKTVDSSTNDHEEILALFGGKLPFSDEEGFEGELFLMPESLIVSESGRTTYSYTVSDCRRYDNLDSNDMAYIPKTVEKSGLTLTLKDVDWQVTGSDDMGYSQVATQYSAVAYYTAPATGSKASGYTATASFSGDVSKQMIGKNTYTIVYEGEQIVIPYNFAPLIAVGIILAGCIVAAAVFWRLRRNVTIYTLQQGVPELYGKVRLSYKNPILDLSRLTDVSIRLVFDRGFVKKLYDQKVFVIGRFTNYQINITGSLVQELPPQRNAESAPGYDQDFSDDGKSITYGGEEA